MARELLDRRGVLVLPRREPGGGPPAARAGAQASHCEAAAARCGSNGRLRGRSVYPSRRAASRAW